MPATLLDRVTPVKVDATYTTPVEVHNPLEMHASVAEWHGDKLETYESTQWVVGQRKGLAAISHNFTSAP